MELLFTKVSAPLAEEVCQRYEPAEEAAKLLTPELAPKEFFVRLIEETHYAEAIRFLAHGLPAPVAIQWAVGCLRRLPSKPLPQKDSAVVGLLERWLAKPAEDLRRRAWDGANGVGFDKAAGCAALAVFFSGGSVAPPDAPEVPPPPYQSNVMAAAAILMCAVDAEPDKIEKQFRSALAMGAQLAQ